MYDIALLKLNSHIGITRSLNGRYYTVNSICLPDSHSVNTDKELALFAGFGYIDEGVSNPGQLRTGWLKLLKTLNNNRHDLWGNQIQALRYPIGKGLAVCRGDSGGPLIQYVSGGSSDVVIDRAVLIGVAKGFLGQPLAGGCLSADPNTYMTFIRVSKKIDWIIQTVLNN
ncbi:plasminogen-like [Oppia nitens]|uniref:plasminogen-like n=1 Tax=Oppia nitens TaxID=1686743 RepID=UPI0023DC3753|nr:plasminogen-like [Oppia nitens]